MAPPLLPARHYGPTRPVTEDTPPDLLEGTMDLHVTLPSEKTVLMNVHRSTPMMDLLIQVTTAHRIAPGGHIIQVLSDNIFLSYKPSTPIGTLDTCAIKIVPKNKVNEAANMRRKSLQQQAQERNVRLKVNLPRNQLAVYRVPPRILISEVLRMVCKDKHLDEESHEIRHPVNIDERLRGSCSLTDYQLQEICVVSKDFRAPPLSVTDLITMTSISHPEDKKRRGFLGFFSRKPKSSTGDSSVSSGSAGERSVSPARSDESAEGHPVSCALSPVSSSGTITNHLNGHHNKSSAASTSSQNQSTNSLASSSSSSARLSRPVSMMSLAKTRKRPAPIPPSQIKSTTNMDSKAHSSKEIKNSLSRNGSASSDTHTQEMNTSPTNTLTSKANSLETLKSDQPLPSNLTQMNSSSMSSISSKSKRRAPAPPKLPIKKAPSAIPEEDCEQLNNTSDASSSPVVDSSVESNTISYDKQISLSSHSDSDPPSSETVMNSDDCSGDSKRNTNSSIETVSPSVDDIDSSVDETETPLKASIPMEPSMENHEKLKASCSLVPPAVPPKPKSLINSITVGNKPAPAITKPVQHIGKVTPERSSLKNLPADEINVAQSVTDVSSNRLTSDSNVLPKSSTSTISYLDSDKSAKDFINRGPKVIDVHVVESIINNNHNSIANKSTFSGSYIDKSENYNNSTRSKVTGIDISSTKTLLSNEEDHTDLDLSKSNHLGAIKTENGQLDHSLLPHAISNDRPSVPSRKKWNKVNPTTVIENFSKTQGFSNQSALNANIKENQDIFSGEPIHQSSISAEMKSWKTSEALNLLKMETEDAEKRPASSTSSYTTSSLHEDPPFRLSSPVQYASGSSMYSAEEDETPSQSEELNTNLSSCEPLYDEINEDSRIPPSRHKKLRSTIPEERRSTDLSSPTKIDAVEEVIIEQKPCKEATDDLISNERSDSPCSSKNFDRVDERDEVFDVSGILKVAEEFFKEEGSANSLSKSNLTEAINPNVVDNDDRKTVEELIEEYVDEALILEDSKPIKYNLVSDSNDELGSITTTEDCAEVTAVENSIDTPTQEFGIDASDENSADANAECSTDLKNIQNHIKKDYTSRVHLSFDEFATKKPVQRSVSVTRITNNASPITENNNNNNEGFVKENLLDELKSTIIDNDPKIVNLKPKLKDWNGNKNDYNVILSFENTNPIRSLNALDRTDSLSSYESFHGSTRNVRSSTESSYESAPPPLPETSVPKLPDYPELGSLQSSSPELLLSDLESRSSTLSRLSECPSSDSRTSSLSKKPLRESPIPPSESRCSTLSRQTIPESSEISEPRSSSVSRQSSFSDCDRKEFSKPRSPATTFSISTYKSRAERLSYDKKLVRSESLTSFNDIQKDIIAPSSPDHVKDNYQWKKLNRSDSQRNEIYRSDEAINKRCVIRMNRDFVPNHSSPEQIEESDESSEPEQSPPKDIPEDFKSRWAVFEKKSMSTNRLQDTPKRDYMPTKEAKGINDSYLNSFNLRKTKSTFDVRDGPTEERLPGGFSAVPDSGLNSEYMRLQDDFVKWQQQLLQNQHVLHSRVAPIATNPPTVSAMGNAHSGGAQKKPMEINIPIRFEGSDEIVQPRTKQPSPPSRTSNANHQMPNSFGQPDKVPFGNASSWNSSPSVQVGAWQERPLEQRVQSEGYNGRPNQTFTSSNEDPTMIHSPLQQGYQQQPHSLQQGYQPKIIQQGCQPQNVQQRFQPQNVQQGYQPQNVQQGYQPQNVQQGYQPQNVQQGYQPQNVQQGYQPHNVQQGYQPHNVQQGYQPQNGHKGYRTQNIQPSQNPQPGYQPQNFQQGFQLQNSQQNYQPQIMKQEPQPPVVQPQYKSNSPPSHVNPTARKPQANVQQPKYQQPQSQPKQPLANVEKQNASKPTSFGREPKTDDNINARFTSVVTLNNDQTVPQKDKVRSIVQLNNTEPSPAMAPILRASNEPSSSFNSKIIKNAPQSSSSNRERRSPSSSSEVEAPMSFRLVQQATQQQQQQPNKSAERNSSPKYSSSDASRLSPPKQVIPDKPRYSPPKPMMPEEPRVFIPKQMSPPVPNIPRVSPSTEGMPPPPPPPPPSGNMPPPPPPPPMCDRRTSTGKKIIPSSVGSTNELDAREELMMAIRNFGGSNRLRKSQNVPHH